MLINNLFTYNLFTYKKVTNNLSTYKKVTNNLFAHNLPSFKRALIVLFVTTASLALGGCSSTTVRTTEVVPIMQQSEEIAEELLLDVGIAIFDPGHKEALESTDEDVIVFTEVRNAEARYFPNLVSNTLQGTASWGAVRVVPTIDTAVDVLVQGKILHSDGETLILNMSVSDATGRQWFSKEYNAVASRYAYDPKRKTQNDAFQNIYNELANDMIAYKQNLTRTQILNTRTVSELKFAKNFAPQTFENHLGKNESGQLVVQRLPADNDPMMNRIRQIRERDYLFIDTMQEYYGTFAKEMEQPYWRWRQESYDEVMALRNLQRSANERLAVGTAALIAGIFAASNSSSAVARTTGSVAMAGGGYVIKSGLDKDSESKIHIEALQELGDSLEASIEPQIIELEDRTVTLSGTVDNQYQQWKEILQQIYQIDTGTQSNQ